jgi:hypothetical protein
MLQFRTINYGRMIYESLRAYFALNSNNLLSKLYKFVFACLYPLQPVWSEYNSFRTRADIIANCKYQIGQITNVLNYLFDNSLNRIYITQSKVQQISDPTFGNTPMNFDGAFGWASSVVDSISKTGPIGEPVFGGSSSGTNVVFMIPSDLNTSAIQAAIEQIKINGTNYVIQTF